MKGAKRILSWGYGILRELLGYRKRRKLTAEFRSHINMTPPLHDVRELNKVADDFDILMSGSDQIWNPRYYASSRGLYLLEFSNRRPKVSYASSFGVNELSEQYEKCCAKALADYAMLSVREQTAAGMLSSIGFEAKVHIDPTFLLNSDEWKTYAMPIPHYEQGYICCYVMSGATKLNHYILVQANKLALQMHPRPEIIVLGEKEYHGLLSSHKYVRTAGPREFLSYMAGARLVLTSSFHGTCFSINFRKNFLSVLQRSNPFNSRITDLLARLGLQAQVAYMEDGSCELQQTETAYDESCLSEAVTEAKDYLKSLHYL